LGGQPLRLVHPHGGDLPDPVGVLHQRRSVDDDSVHDGVPRVPQLRGDLRHGPGQAADLLGGPHPARRVMAQRGAAIMSLRSVHEPHPAPRRAQPARTTPLHTRCSFVSTSTTRRPASRSTARTRTSPSPTSSSHMRVASDVTGGLRCDRRLSATPEDRGGPGPNADPSAAPAGPIRRSNAKDPLPRSPRSRRTRTQQPSELAP
jgi:hypothetical protein